jgi:hypothetical protein
MSNENNLGEIGSYRENRIKEFQKTIPFVIGAVAIGVGTVNRTVLKSVMYLLFAMSAALVGEMFTNLGITAFLYSSIAYVVACCLIASGNIDISMMITMPVGFAALTFIDMFVINRTLSSLSPDGSFPYMPYFGTALLSAMWGITGFYIIKVANDALLFDFKGCSCDDCKNSNMCPVNNGLNPSDDNSGYNKTNSRVVMGRILN